MKLTDTAVKNPKGREKPYKLFDGHALFLPVNPNGRKGWRLEYRFNPMAIRSVIDEPRSRAIEPTSSSSPAR